MGLNFSENTPKELVFEHLAEYLHHQNLKINKQDNTRPWGGFFVIEDFETEKFIKKFFPQLTKEEIGVSGKLSPKILVLAPGKRISWQYHKRRAEIWKLISGKALISVSDTDEENEAKPMNLNEIIKLKQGKRHRLTGTDGWGVVAEIWQHTDSEYPSEEDDIVRVQDDFDR